MKEQLRIGNLVEALHQTIDGFRKEWISVEVQSINGYMNTITTTLGQNIDIDEKYLRPIPLTEQWLLKFGFKHAIGESEVWDQIKVSNTDEVWWISGCYFFEKNGDWFQFNHLTDEDTYWTIHPNVQYAHQLQNLYVCLTGEELTIKQ